MLNEDALSSVCELATLARGRSLLNSIYAQRSGKCSFVFHRAKHPVKGHIWAGISWKGRTPIVIFDGILNAEGYETILEQGLLPFLRDVYPSGHRPMQDNDPKHSSNRVKGVKCF